LEKGLYPKHHFWGCDAIKNESLWKTSVITKSNITIPRVINRLLNRLIFRNSPGFHYEFAAWKSDKNIDLIYSVCGPLSLVRFYKTTKVVSWVFRPPSETKLLITDPYNFRNLSAHKGFLCLTRKAHDHFSQFAPSKFIPWCVDQEMFDGKPPLQNPEKPFFLASGKTGRDYETLVKAASDINAEIRIIGPSLQRPRDLPPNVNWIDTSSDPPDQAIDYLTLREWYAQCTAVCIPLNGDANDTCGYTNMLEAMAMRKPVMMTQSGCLHINPEKDGFGFQIKPKDIRGWVDAINHLHKDHKKALAMGYRGREIVERDFTIERFNKDILVFIETILNKS